MEQIALKTDDELIHLKRKKLTLLQKKLEIKYRNIYWAKYVHLNTKNQSMTFRNREFLIDIYKAIATERIVAIMKSVQCGVSEAFIVTHLEQAARGLAILYILPKTDLRNRFVDNRIDRAILRVAKYREVLASALGKADSKSLKMFGAGIMNYVASNSPANFTEFPADAVYYDEVDRMDQATILMAKDRLSDSAFKFERKVSNPTISEYGISYDYDHSSKGTRMFKCSHCGQWQPFDFFTNVVVEKGKRQYDVLDSNFTPEGTGEVRVFCKYCHKPIERFGVRQAWVHEYPTAETRGFHISKMFSPQGNIRDLVKRLLESRHNETKMQVFMNSDLGIPMSGAGVQVTRENVMASRGEYMCGANLERRGVRFAGVDVGNDLHTIIREWDGARKKLIWRGKLKHEDDVLRALRDFGVQKLVIDALPELRLVENLKKASDKIYSCPFSPANEIRINKDRKVVTARRTLMLDRALENYERVLYLNPVDILQDDEYMAHIQSNVRVADPDSGEFMWLQKSNRPDHYLLAEGYCDLAGDLAIGSDIFKAYDNIVKQTEDRDMAATVESGIKDELEELPAAEKERIKKKMTQTADEFFRSMADNNPMPY